MSTSTSLTVDLVRHARSSANLTNTYCNDREDPLDTAAFEDIRQLRERLAHVDYVACFTSPYRRCVETAQGLLGTRAVAAVMNESLREIEHGPWDSLTTEEVQRMYPGQWKIWNTSPDSLEIPGRETLAAVRLRAQDWLSRVTSEIPQGAVLAISHQAVIRVLVATQRDIPMSKVRSIEVPNLGLFRLALRPKEAHLGQTT